MTPAADPLRQLQQAARTAAEHVAPGERAARVVLFDVTGRKLLDVTVPVCLPVSEARAEMDVPVAGWHVTDRIATYDGKRIAVGASRLNLLRVLAEADEPITAKELTSAAFDRQTDTANTRYHIRELRKELKAAFTGFEGEPIQGDDEGYRLVLR
jgi:DNA-binding response OmpR family regulator